MTDIVERLRENKPLVHGEDIDAAAAEIERLRDEKQKAALEYVTLFGELQTALERLAEVEGLLALAQGEHYCGDSECESPFCRAMLAAGKTNTRDAFADLLERLAEAEALLREARDHMAVTMHVTMTGIPPDSLLAHIDAFLGEKP